MRTSLIVAYLHLERLFHPLNEKGDIKEIVGIRRQQVIYGVNLHQHGFLGVAMFFFLRVFGRYQFVTIQSRNDNLFLGPVMLD
jgi:hypothetical protein